jgi:hypothetical protein
MINTSSNKWAAFLFQNHWQDVRFSIVAGFHFPKIAYGDK